MKKLKLSILLVPMILLHGFLNGQPQNNLPKVIQEGQRPFAFAWAGGMNSCQFGALDLDLDGTEDLVSFDRVGDRIMPFLVNGSDNFSYAPEYIPRFPEVSHWVVLADYNGDGKNDLFTYSPGYAGIKVYRNVSGSQLEFRLEVGPYLKSWYGSGYVNILVTYADYPAIADIDGDGDLDILTFWGLGSFVEMHKNLSMEKHGHADSLDYERTETCWGYFAESEESNVITLDTCIGWLEQSMNAAPPNRHTGSTFLLLDLDNDGVKDLLLGDVDYPNLVALKNGGTADSAHMISQEAEFPASYPSWLFSMPVAAYTDLDFDGINDLVLSPFDPNPYVTENFHSVWYYHNSGDNDTPVFYLQNKSFLQDQMLDFGSGTYPVIADYNGDNLPDIMVGNYGYYDTSYMDQNLILHSEYSGKVGVLENTGTPGFPSFGLILRDLGEVSQLKVTGTVPAFMDMDGDGDQDMLMGNEEGTVHYYRNAAGPGNIMQLNLAEMNYQGIDVGSYSTPVCFDLDDDNLADLILGERGGNLNYFKNTGTLAAPVFTLITDSLGRINVTDPNVSLDGYSVPSFYKDPAGKTWLLVGSEQGKIFLYENIDGNLQGEFDESNQLTALIGLESLDPDRGFRSSGLLHDINSDGLPELITGNFCGGLEYFSAALQPGVSGLDEFRDRPAIRVYPLPARDHIHVECLEDGLLIDVLELTDLSGNSLRSSGCNGTKDCRMDLSGMPAGIYIARIICNRKGGMRSSIYHSKIIILRANH